MQRSLRSNTELPNNFPFPDLTRRRQVNQTETMPADENAAPAGAATAQAEVWTENPNQGKFNPGTKAGEAVFKLKTKGLPEDKRLPLN
jgi:hypothetical protein